MLPGHIRIGVPYSIELNGYTSTPKSGLQMVAQRTKCAATVAKIPGNAGIVIPGDIVTGHFQVKDRISFPTASHGSVRYCAYMFHASPPSFTNGLRSSNSSRRVRPLCCTEREACGRRSLKHRSGPG